MTALCRETGISPSALSNYRAGRIKRLSVDKLSKTSGYFGATTGSLLGKICIGPGCSG
ncbi:helix-turn-helix domain-containing protein [Neobittarella massiliensis]|uniref:Helix-turn-helix domain-containing protein n=1 Tax=Neobittarella massiliensis (ex Bilen et al. 2018) TaxID=2041842 RepID=A0A8J6IQP7_9FIRM|nr:helix-turn-helix domain-containing protein [Neobittarella massiliensis]